MEEDDDAEEETGRERWFLPHRGGSKINYAVFLHRDVLDGSGVFLSEFGSFFFREFVIGSVRLTSRGWVAGEEGKGGGGRV